MHKSGSRTPVCKAVANTHVEARTDCLVHISVWHTAMLQLSRFSMKNMLNAMTDLQRIQHMLMGVQGIACNIRSGLRMHSFLYTFKRAAATAIRR